MTWRRMEGRVTRVPELKIQMGAHRVRPPKLGCLCIASLWFLLHLCAGCDGEKPRANARDFSKTNRVCALLGEEQQEHGNGLEHIYWVKDGFTTATNLDGVPCRSMKLETGSMGYLYFVIDPSFKKGGTKNVKIEVEYFDGPEGVFGIQYDGNKETYQWVEQEIPLRGSLLWLTGRFNIKSARFRNRQNAKADFRLWVSPPELRVRRVMITRS